MAKIDIKWTRKRNFEVARKARVAKNENIF